MILPVVNKSLKKKLYLLLAIVSILAFTSPAHAVDVNTVNSMVDQFQRGLVAWQRIIFPNGSSMSLGTMQGTDKAGYAGFKDKVDNHYGRIFGQATLISMFSALGQIAVSDNGNTNQSSSQDNRETLAEELGRQWSQTGQELIKRNLNIAPTIRIRPGYEFNVMVNKDMILKPYGK